MVFSSILCRFVVWVRFSLNVCVQSFIVSFKLLIINLVGGKMLKMSNPMIHVVIRLFDINTSAKNTQFPIIILHFFIPTMFAWCPSAVVTVLLNRRVLPYSFHFDGNTLWCTIVLLLPVSTKYDVMLLSISHSPLIWFVIPTSHCLELVCAVRLGGWFDELYERVLDGQCLAIWLGWLHT